MYDILLQVTDDEGAVGTKAFQITATNRAPGATLIVPAQVLEGQSFVVGLDTLSDSLDDLATGLLFDFDFDDDGVWEVVGLTQPTTTHTYLEDGAKLIRARVRDRQGAAVTITQSLLVINDAPTAVFSLATPNGTVEGAAGVLVQFTSAADPSPQDTAAGFRYSFDLDNDGIFEIDAVTQSSQPLALTQDGHRIVRGRITDRDGGSRDYMASLSVVNALPSVGQLQMPAAIVEGSEIAFTLPVSDPGTDALQAEVTIRSRDNTNDPGIRVPASIIGDQLQFSYRFPTERSDGYSIVVTVQDDHDTVSRAFNVDVSNFAPVISTQLNGVARAGQSWSRLVEFQDPGSDNWLVNVNYGDGSAIETFSAGDDHVISLSHVYMTPGQHTVNVSLGDGSVTSSVSFIVDVSTNSAPVVARPIGGLNVPQATRMRRRAGRLEPGIC